MHGHIRVVVLAEKTDVKPLGIPQQADFSARNRRGGRRRCAEAERVEQDHGGVLPSRIARSGGDQRLPFCGRHRNVRAWRIVRDHLLAPSRGTEDDSYG